MVLPASPPASRHASLLLKLSLTKPQSTGKASVSSPSIVTLQHGRGQARVCRKDAKGAGAGARSRGLPGRDSQPTLICVRTQRVAP